MDKVDMSLDDIIKMQKKQKKQSKVTPNKPGATQKGGLAKKPYMTKQQVMQKKPFNKPQIGTQKVKQQTKLNMKPKPNRTLRGQNAQSSPSPRRQKPGQNQQQQQRSPQKRRPGPQVGGGRPFSLVQQKAQKVQQRVDQRRRMQQNRVRVNRAGSISSNQSNMSDAKLLKLAKALLLKKTGSNLLDSPTTNVAYSARQLKRQQQKMVMQTLAQSSPPRRRRWNRMNNANPNKPDSLLTVSVKNELANSSGPGRRRLNRSTPRHETNFLVQTVNNPAARGGGSPQQQYRTGAPKSYQQQQQAVPEIRDIVKSMKPKIEMSYDFSKDVFAQAKTGLGLSDRFSSDDKPVRKPQGAPGSRLVYL